ncbi:hypothetical protein F5890DRAFT_1380177, partial [Lentinula detonsa]
VADLGVLLIPFEQQGCGKSAYCPEETSDTSFWSAQLFLDELRTVLQHLGIRCNHILEVHSWGVILGACHEILLPNG